MSHENITMPSVVRQELDLLLAMIKRATTSDEAERAGLRAEGFVLGVERLKALQPASIEALYLVVEQTVELRVDELGTVNGPVPSALTRETVKKDCSQVSLFAAGSLVGGIRQAPSIELAEQRTLDAAGYLTWAQSVGLIDTAMYDQLNQAASDALREWLPPSPS
jgi:hypothetical protein